ncbi:hypothetical protein [Corynebacterium sp. A21]|uniref:hypothetical protein n=1 Tax=Corynebacterium sp. A21 TaxID=3457318 RepID=UPI003FD25D4D
MTFDYPQWVEGLKRIPEYQMMDCFRDLREEMKRREAAPAVAAGQAALLEALRETGQLAPDAIIPTIPLIPAEPVTSEGESPQPQ